MAESNAMKLETVTGPAQVQQAAAVAGNLAIRAIGGGLPTQDIGHQWSLQAVDAQTGAVVPGAQWGFAPWPFIRFVGSNGVGGVINLQANDLGDNPIEFACQAAGTSVTATAPGYVPATQNIQSRSPNNPDGQPIMSQPAVFIDGNGLTWCRLGPPNDVGIDIGFTAAANGCAGSLAAIQLVNTTRTFRSNTGAESKSTGGAWALDIATNQNTFLYLDRVVGLNQALQISDSPAQQLGGPFNRFEVNENFMTWIMFQSNTPNANWMPLFLVRWGWTATAVLDNGVWRLTAGAPLGPDDAATLAFPVWSTNINEYQWVGGGAAATDRAVRSPSRDGAATFV
jgi:hypothetical protein